MTYQVKEIYYTLQGEGARSGRAAVFLRFAGCNLWSGLERDRPAAVCRFCDTDFVGTDGLNGGKFNEAETLALVVAESWPKDDVAQPYVVCTGGEPLLQLDETLIAALHAHGFEIGVETNGTLLPPAGIQWICVSPKANAALALKSGQELKLVYPQENAPPERYAGLVFEHFFLQPMDGPGREANTRAAADYCLAHPQWRLSLQMHKSVGIR
ncbi:MAG: 7-carboxy-7-deazaguanine synthase [Alphaproteobacteria bacterium]|nr:7-carboxy-7-deazaguanine synthase [Alphaproteobacteria bacterium]MDE2110684.1 7-carboxy-7-deazaguanine synthase [Alphaproteobacteria bacterium]MDE2494489.1 7-carboxy-7-deazaguanine synthase [Alphaproteobacteria bacterium]